MTTSTFTTGHRQLVFDTTRWQRILTERRSYRGVLADGIAAAATAKVQVENDGDSPRGKVIAATPDMMDLATEIFARAYNGPERLETPSGEVEIAEVVHDLVGEMPEWKALCAQVEGDPDFSAMATGEVLKTVAEKMPELIAAAKARKEQDDDEDGDGPGKPGEGEGKGKGQGPGLPGPEDVARAAIRRGIREAQKKITEGKDDLEGLAPGLGAAPPMHQQEDPARLELAERLSQDQRLRGVLKKAGRISRLASKAKRTRTSQARSEVVDIERGNDIARILPAALARLKHPLLRKLALRDIVEATAPQYKLEGKETLGRGPIVIALDRSGSMNGSPGQWASAAAIALSAQAAKERRAITIIEFTSAVDEIHKMDEKGRTSKHAWRHGGYIPGTYAVKSGTFHKVSDLDGLKSIAMTLATRRSGGGTDFDPMLRCALDAGLLDDRADFILVTDGMADVCPEILEELNTAKGKGLRVFALTLNGGSLSGSIQAISDISIDLDRVEDIAVAIAEAQAAASKLA